MFTNYCINSIIFQTVFTNTCPIQEKYIHVSRLAFFFFFICLGDSQLVSDLAKSKKRKKEKTRENTVMSQKYQSGINENML